jgi:hypothetical protein
LLGSKQAGGERRNCHGTAAGEGQTLWSRQGAAGVGCYGIRGVGGAPAVLEKATIVFDAPSSEVPSCPMSAGPRWWAQHLPSSGRNVLRQEPQTSRTRLR